MCSRLATLLLIMAAIWMGPLTAYSQAARSPAEQLKADVAELQSHPDDQALRERIIKLARSMQPPPAVPDIANSKLIDGMAAFIQATDAAGIEVAITDFKAAVNAAPWLANGYRTLSHAQEKVGKFKEASESLKFYLLAAPLTKVAADVQAKIADLEGRDAQKVKSFLEQTVAANKKAQDDQLAADKKQEADALAARRSVDLPSATQHPPDEAVGKDFPARLVGGVWTFALSPTATLQLEYQDGNLVEFISDSRTRIHHVHRNDYPVVGRVAHKVSADGRFEWLLTISPDAATITVDSTVTSDGQQMKSNTIYHRQ